MVYKTLGEKLYIFTSNLIYYSGIITDKVCEPVENFRLLKWISLENIEKQYF